VERPPAPRDLSKKNVGKREKGGSARMYFQQIPESFIRYNNFYVERRRQTRPKEKREKGDGTRYHDKQGASWTEGTGGGRGVLSLV